MHDDRGVAVAGRELAPSQLLGSPPARLLAQPLHERRTYRKETRVHTLHTDTILARSDKNLEEQDHHHNRAHHEQAQDAVHQPRLLLGVLRLGQLLDCIRRIVDGLLDVVVDPVELRPLLWTDRGSDALRTCEYAKPHAEARQGMAHAALTGSGKGGLRQRGVCDRLLGEQFVDPPEEA